MRRTESDWEEEEVTVASLCGETSGVAAAAAAGSAMRRLSSALSGPKRPGCAASSFSSSSPATSAIHPHSPSPSAAAAIATALLASPGSAGCSAGLGGWEARGFLCWARRGAARSGRGEGKTGAEARALRTGGGGLDSRGFWSVSCCFFRGMAMAFAWVSREVRVALL